MPPLRVIFKPAVTIFGAGGFSLFGGVSLFSLAVNINIHLHDHSRRSFSSSAIFTDLPPERRPSVLGSG